MKCKKCGTKKRLTFRSDGRERWRCSQCVWLQYKEKHKIPDRGALGAREIRLPKSRMLLNKTAYPGRTKWDRLNPEKRRAHKIVENAIVSGRLIPQPCKVCCATAHAHHEDYTKPLKVMWLCPAHHSKHHLFIKKQALSQGRENA
jgi:hypothetical protein